MKKTHQIKRYSVHSDAIGTEKALQPGAYQHQVGRAGRQQPDGEPEMQAFAGGLADRAHGQKHRAILARESQAIFLQGFRTRLRLRDSRENPRPRGRGEFSPAYEFTAGPG